MDVQGSGQEEIGGATILWMPEIPRSESPDWAWRRAVRSVFRLPPGFGRGSAEQKLEIGRLV
jgi:hypothetical protein